MRPAVSEPGGAFRRQGASPPLGPEPGGASATDAPFETAEPEAPSMTRLIGAPAAAAAFTIAFAFLVWSAVESALSSEAVSLHRLYLVRGVSTSLVTAAVVLAVSWAQHRKRDAELKREAARRAHEAREARAVLELVVDNTPAALVVLDPSFNVVQANSMARHVHGQDLLGHRCSDVLAACADHCRDCPAAASFSTGDSQTVLRPHTDPRTGEVLAVESHPFAHPDGRRFVLLVERVITEQQKLHARLLHQEKMAAIGLLSAGIAHDLGNPLSSIEAQLQLLDESSFGDENTAAITSVRQEVGRLRRILRELVDFARRRRDEATLVSVQSAVEDALRILRHDPRMRAVKIETSFDPDVPPVQIVEDHIVQVVLNLFLNSVDAMPNGGTLRIEIAPAGHQVALRIHDTGIGMDHAVLGRCLEPLFTTKAPGKGTGLGLSISRDILQAAGGDLELHSSSGRGTTAIVALPAAVSRDRQDEKHMVAARASA